MALFKISKGASGGLNNQALGDGYCWFTYDDGKFYIDYKDPTDNVVKRKALNANNADHDHLGNLINSSYAANLTFDNSTYILTLLAKSGATLATVNLIDYELTGALNGNTYTYTLTPFQDGTALTSAATSATIPSMSAATGSTAGAAGLVPAPQAGAQDKFLRGDGTWVDLFSEYDAMVFKGIVIQDSDLPTSGYSAGWTYRAAADGIYKGEYCEVGDLIIAVNDYDSSTASNADWTKIEHNIDGALFMGHAGSALSDGTKLLNVTGGGVVTTSSSTVGSLTKPVFLNAGTLTETTHSLNATINSGTANQVAYYSDANTIDSMAPAWQPWTAGSTNGPQANIQIGNAIYQSAAIPSATATNSGIVTTGAQTFAGDKTFQGNIFPAVSDSYNLGSTALRWKFLYGVRGIDLTNAGATGITVNNTDIVHSSSYKVDAAGLAGIYDDSHTFWVLSTDQPYGDTWLKSKANRNIIFERNGTENARFDTTGHFIPGTTETFNLGSTTNYWNNAYIKNIIYSSGEANRLVWTDSDKLLKATNHYADATSIAINSTTIPTPPTGYPTYNLYINGDARSSGDLYFEGTNNKLAAFKLTTVGTVSRANIDMGWDWEKLDGAGAAFRSTDPNLAANQIGRFVLFARTTADDTTQLVGAPTGELSWKKVSGAARIGINADANANYNLYVNGNTKIESSPAADTPLVTFVSNTTPSTGGYQHGLHYLVPNMVSDSNAALYFGKAASTGNAVCLQMNWVGDNHNNNFFGLGFWGVNNLLRIYKTGNVSIGEANNTYKLYVAGNTVIGNGGGLSRTQASAAHHIVSPGGGSYTTSTSTITGALKIRLPVSWTSAMMNFTVDIYNYVNNDTSSYHIGGYNYSSTSNWHSISASSTGVGNKSNLTVRFGHDGTYCCIFIGEIDTVWNYPQINVRDVYLGYSNQNIATWSHNWQISFVTELPTIAADRTITNPNKTRDGTANRIAWYPTALSVASSDIITDGSYIRNVGGYNNTSYAFSAASAIINSWIRTVGATGWYNETYSGGWYMADAKWIRSHSNKPVYIDIGSNNSYGIGTHRLALGLNGANHVSLMLKGGDVMYGFAVNNNGNWYFGKRTTKSFENATNDAYIFQGDANGIYPSTTIAKNLGSPTLSWNNIHTKVLQLNRNKGAAYGRISFYADTYYTWYDYMSDAANGACPTGGKPGTLGNVTSWARRSIIENAANYGWTWEAASNAAASANTVQPTTVMALSSNNGKLTVNGSSVPMLHLISSVAENSIYFESTDANTAGTWAVGKRAWSVAGFGIGKVGTGSFISILDGGNVGIGTNSPSYKLHVVGDMYTSGWARAASGFYCHDTGVHYTHKGNHGEINITKSNEMIISGSANTLYINYQAASRGTLVTTFRFHGGSSTSYSQLITGHIIPGADNTYTLGSTSSLAWNYVCARNHTLYAGSAWYGDFHIYRVGTANSGDGNATRGTQGLTLLRVGNGVAWPAAGTAGGANNSTGIVRIYAENTYFTDIMSQAGSANRTFYLPNYNANMYAVHAGNNNAVGSATQPVYVAANGRVTACTAYGSGAAGYLSLPRVTQDYNTLPGNNLTMIKEYHTSSANRPTNHWYHAITSKGSDGNYGTQFAMGMTITRLYYRNYNAGTWAAWKQVWIAGDSVTSAVWNDYAEYRETDTMEAGRCVIEVGDDSMTLSTKRLQRGCSITSDTWGFAQGETEKAKTPIAVSGRVLAYPYESREEFASHIGWPVCSGPNGTVSIMTEEEEEKYPSRIIGTISAIPNYEEWGGGENADRPPVKVNGRVWIRIR